MIAEQASQVIDVFRRRVYAGPIERVVTKLGLQSYLSSAYWAVILALADDTHTRTVAGVDATFKITTAHEYNRFHDPSIKGETEILEAVLSALDADDVFYDIGANVGLYTCFAGHKTTDGTVVAFEPHPGNVERIEENVDLNGITATVCEVALAKEDGSASLEVHEDVTGVVGNVSKGTDSAELVQLPIDLRNGDGMIEQGEIPVPDVVKIDVDGGEADVVRGLADTLGHPDCRSIYCEIHPGALEEYGASAKEVHEVLEEVGFELERMEVEHQMRKDAYFVFGNKR